jgi:L-arabinose isomerase
MPTLAAISAMAYWNISAEHHHFALSVGYNVSQFAKVGELMKLKHVILYRT